MQQPALPAQICEQRAVEWFLTAAEIYAEDAAKWKKKPCNMPSTL